MDKTPKPYIFLKNALYDGRVKIPKHDRLMEELVSLEWDETKSKVDHLPAKSKDLADCLAAVVYGLTVQRWTWIEHQVPIVEVRRFAREFKRQERSMGAG